MTASSSSVDRLRRIGVIGAGQMGAGIAHVCVLAGLEVVLTDVHEEALRRVTQTIISNLSRQVGSGKIREEDKEAAIGRMHTGPDYARFADCDMVIEAATENEEVKREIFKKLGPVLKPDALIATNTSSISITRLAASTDRPGKFIGMHFMTPVPVMNLVELIRGIATDEDTLKATRDLALKLGKTLVAAEDFPAFIVNRILLPMINEAVYTLYEGVGSVAAIDTAMKLGANHPMGPARTRRFYRARHVPRDHAGAPRGARRQQVPALPAVGQICRSRLARPQNEPRVLRLPRRKAGPDPVKCGILSLSLVPWHPIRYQPVTIACYS
jgi:3-hydroxybutyryl-CoA dehydrogenase